MLEVESECISVDISGILVHEGRIGWAGVADDAAIEEATHASEEASVDLVKVGTVKKLLNI